MKKAKFHEHEVLGRLELVAPDLWCRDSTIRFGGEDWPVSLSVQWDPEDGFEESQVRAMIQFTEGREEILASAEDELRRHAMREHGIEADRFLTAVKPTGIVFPYLRREPTFGLLFDCEWDPGHGVAIRFVNGRIADVGQQDIVL